MVLVEAGEFLRGASDDEITLAVRNCIQEGGGACPPEFYDDAQPQTNVTLGAFYIDRTEVTNAQYALCVAAGGCDSPLDTTRYDDPAYTNHPVTNITWAQAASYCAAQGKRLPSEAEWEKAARGTEARIWPWGDSWEPGKANSAAAQLGGPSTVEAFAGDVSPYGVIGLAGNVSEWVNDWYQGNYDNLALVDPQGPLAQPGAEPIKVARGGAYKDLSSDARGAMRLGVRSGGQADWLGFRCVANLTSAPVAPPAGAAPAEGAEDEAPAPEATVVPTPTQEAETTG
jgi:serine/threonine-protein kinase